jgi:hypothetical protein
MKIPASRGEQGRVVPLLQLLAGENSPRPQIAPRCGDGCAALSGR